jgi:hypothetical protein
MSTPSIELGSLASLDLIICYKLRDGIPHNLIQTDKTLAGLGELRNRNGRSGALTPVAAWLSAGLWPMECKCLTTGLSARVGV